MPVAQRKVSLLAILSNQLPSEFGITDAEIKIAESASDILLMESFLGLDQFSLLVAIRLCCIIDGQVSSAASAIPARVSNLTRAWWQAFEAACLPAAVLLVIIHLRHLTLIDSVGIGHSTDAVNPAKCPNWSIGVTAVVATQDVINT